MGFDAVFHEGVYLARDPKIAKKYGKNINAYNVDIKKTYNITTDDDLLKLFTQAGIKDPEQKLYHFMNRHWENKRDELIKKYGTKEGIERHKKIRPKYYFRTKNHGSRDDFILEFTAPALKQARTWLIDNGYDSVDIKKNRLELLQMFCKTYNSFIDFSKVEGV